MTRFTGLLFVLLAAPALASAADDAKDEMKKLVGAWKVSSAEIDGNAVDAKALGMTEMIVTDGKLLFQNEGKDVKTFDFTVDPSKKPKAMDWVKDKNSITLPCIYALDGDELKLCMPLLKKKGSDVKLEIKRPESFATKGLPVGTVTLKREKK